MSLLVFLLLSVLEVPNTYFVSLPEQGNAYITCMPGPVRRWNYPVPLCLGNVLFYGLTFHLYKDSTMLYSWQQHHFVASNTVSLCC